jgi:hypothetical protein
MSDMTIARATASGGERGQRAHDPAALRAVRRLWSACPKQLRRALQRTGIPYVVGVLARYRRAHSAAHFAGSLLELKADYARGPAERRAALSARFEAIIDALVLPNGVRKTTYSRRQAEVLSKVLAHEQCTLEGGALRVLDVPSSAGVDSLHSYAMLGERYPIASYVLGDLCFEIVYDPRRRCVFDEEGNLLQVGLGRQFFSIYRAHVCGDIYTWLTRVLLLPLDLYASYLKKRYPYTESAENRRIRVVHPDVEARVSDVLQLAKMDVFEGFNGPYDLILSFNLLQRTYFPPERIALGVENLGRALAEGGLMMIGNTESFVVLRKRGGQLLSLLREDVGALAISP